MPSIISLSSSSFTSWQRAQKMSTSSFCYSYNVFEISFPSHIKRHFPTQPDVSSLRFHFTLFSIREERAKTKFFSSKKIQIMKSENETFHILTRRSVQKVKMCPEMLTETFELSLKIRL